VDSVNFVLGGGFRLENISTADLRGAQREDKGGGGVVATMTHLRRLGVR